MPMALEGIKVLDLSRVAPGLFCTMMLGDLGADVIKIEAPVDTSASAGAASPEEQMEAANKALNRNKRSIVLNLKNEEAKAIFFKLAQTADVVVEGFRPGVVKRLGIDFEAVQKVNPRIIYCSISGYGQDGPYRLLPGHDLNYIALTGALAAMGAEKNGKFGVPLNLVADFAGGTLHSVIGILAALVSRQKTGLGQYVDTAMADGVISLLTFMAADYFANGVVPRRGENLLTGYVSPFYSIYETKDRKHIAVGCVEPHFWSNLCKAIGKEEFIPHQLAEGTKKDEVFLALRQVFLTKTRQEWFEFLATKDVPASPVNDMEEAFKDPQILHRKMFVVNKDSEGNPIKQVGPGIKLSATPASIRTMPPSPGQDTTAILKSLGLKENEITQLKQRGAIG